MKIREGDVIAGRFAVQADVARFANERAWARKAFWFGRDMGSINEDDLWLRGVDQETGAPVLIEPRRWPHNWIDDLALEAAARRVAAISSPFTAPILHVGPGVVYAEHPAGLPRGGFAGAEAALLTLQACEVVAALHAAGVSGPPVDPYNLRVVGEAGHRHIDWLAPGAPELQALGYLTRPSTGDVAMKVLYREPNLVARDVWKLVDFFASLQPEEALALGQHPTLDALVRMHRDPADGLPDHVASLARLLLPLAPASTELAARVASLPAVSSLPPLALDWDEIIADGEAQLAAEGEGWRFRGYIALPLAAAYHQRASRSWGDGDRSAALRDGERAIALDGEHLPYPTTRAVALDALGRGAEARRALDEAIAQAQAALPNRNFFGTHAPSDAELARAHATRGMIALRHGAPADAERDLARAMELCPTALYAHALGAARYALGDIAGAAEAEARSIELEPTNARYRWAQVASLRKLGHEREARVQAEEIVARWPDTDMHRARFKKLFGGAGESYQAPSQTPSQDT